MDAEVITVLDGGKDLFMWPIPGDYLSTAEDTPQVQVEVKSKDGWLSASCTGVCKIPAVLGDELPQAALHLPLALANMRRPLSPWVWATDATPVGGGACEGRVSGPFRLLCVYL